MQSYKIEKIMPDNGILTLRQLPFNPDELLEIIINNKERKCESSELKGSVLEYKDPFEPIAEDDWDVLQ